MPPRKPASASPSGRKPAAPARATKTTRAKKPATTTKHAAPLPETVFTRRTPAQERRRRFYKRVQAFARKLRRKSFEKQVIMLVPHSGRASITVHIPNLLIALTATTIVVVILVSLFTLNTRESDQTELRKLSTLSALHEDLIGIYRSQAHITDRSFSRLQAELRRLSEGFGDAGAGVLEVERLFRGQGGPTLPEGAPPELTPEEERLDREIRRIEEYGNSLSRSAEQIGEVSSFFSNMRTLMVEVPSIWPVLGVGIVSSPFGIRRSPFTGAWQMHTGIDIAWWPGTPIVASADGVVSQTGYMGAYGLCVIVEHKYGFSTRYAHLQHISVEPGQRIARGHQLGGMGNTGHSTGYHLHYEVMLESSPVDPAPYLTAKFF